MPEVTILMASYNRLPLLKESVASALAQEYPSFEVLIVDDGSAEETIAWLKELAAQDSRVRVIFSEHAGVATARAIGVEAATSPYITILDSDDILEPGALKRLVEALKASVPSILVYGNIRHLYKDGTTRIRRYPRYRSNQAMITSILMSPRVPFKHSGMTFHRDRVLKLGNYDRSLPSKIDIDFILRILRANEKIHLLDGEPVVAFRVHAGSMSRRRRSGVPVWFQLIDKYGPASWVARSAQKSARAAAELLKEAYVYIAKQ